MTDDQDTPRADPEGPAESAGQLADRMGIELVSATTEQVIATMPVEGNTQPYGLMHGGASCVLAETAGSVAAALYAAPGKQAVGIEINATHHRAARSGKVTAVATPAHLGRSLATYQVLVTDERDRTLCTARLTCMLMTLR